MKRAILAVIIFLLLGAATSIALAWAAVLWNIGAEATFVVESDGWVGRFTQLAGRVEVSAAPSNSLLGKWWRTHDRYPFRAIELPGWSRLHKPPGAHTTYARETAAGWPLLCLYFVEENDDSRDRSLGFDGRGGWGGHNPLTGLDWNWSEADELPVGVLWWRLAANALLYGAAWFVLLRLPILWTVSRAIRRRRKARCPWCGYDRRESEAERCPECGHEGPFRPAIVSSGALWCASFMLLGLAGVETAFAAAFVANQPFAPIHHAAWNGDVETIRAELARGVDVDLPTRQNESAYSTPLSLAAMNGRPDAIRCLLDAGADSGFRGFSGMTPLHRAAMSGTYEGVQALIEGGADVNATSGGGSTPLCHALCRKTGFPGIGKFDPRIIHALIDAGADVNFQMRGGRTPLSYACQSGTIEAIQVLLESGATVDPEDASLGRLLPYPGVIGPDPIAVARILLDQGLAVDDEAMRRAVSTNNMELLELLMEHGGDVIARNEDGETLLFELAPLKEHRPLWEFLLDHGVDINALNDRGVSVLMYWLEDDRRRNVGLADRREWVAFVLDRGADPALGEHPAMNTLDGEIAEMLRRAMEVSGGADDER